jgi:hypothetical protein
LKEPLGVDQDIVRSGAASFTPNPMYVDPDNLVRRAIEGGCNAIQDAYLSDDVTIAQRRARRRALRIADVARCCRALQHERRLGRLRGDGGPRHGGGRSQQLRGSARR